MGPHVYVYYYYCSHAQNEKKIEMNMRTRLPVYSKFKGFSVRAGAVIKSLLGDWNKKANIPLRFPSSQLHTGHHMVSQYCHDSWGWWWWGSNRFNVWGHSCVW